MSDTDTIFVASIDELKKVFKQIEKLNAKWDGDECPECHLKLKKRSKALLSGSVLECPVCKKGFDRAEDYIISRLTELQTNNASIEEMDNKTLRGLLQCEAKENLTIKDFT
jgi:hypothetical protein